MTYRGLGKLQSLAVRSRVTLGGCLWLNSDSATASLLETSGSGLSEIRNCKAETRDALKHTSIRALLDGAGAGASGEAITLRAASGTANIAKMDKTGARALEEQLIFASVWAGASIEEAAERVSYQADTSYLSSEFDLSKVVSLMLANQTADSEGKPFLSMENMYAVLDRAVPGVLSSYEDNEVQKTDLPVQSF
ncbi:MAG: hypothetical protein Q4G68_13485 [Planctomycetia bacterium]|nr:hypothetical protein [Planctomycetia bacterium]